MLTDPAGHVDEGGDKHANTDVDQVQTVLVDLSEQGSLGFREESLSVRYTVDVDLSGSVSGERSGKSSKDDSHERLGRSGDDGEEDTDHCERCEVSTWRFWAPAQRSHDRCLCPRTLKSGNAGSPLRMISNRVWKRNNPLREKDQNTTRNM